MIVEFQTPMMPGVTLFVVTTPEDGKKLIDEGVGRGRIYSPKEIALIGKLILSKNDLEALAHTKHAFDARVQDVLKKDA
jgi:hypothetical protein